MASALCLPAGSQTQQEARLGGLEGPSGSWPQQTPAGNWFKPSSPCQAQAQPLRSSPPPKQSSKKPDVWSVPNRKMHFRIPKTPKTPRCIPLKNSTSFLPRYCPEVYAMLLLTYWQKQTNLAFFVFRIGSVVKLLPLDFLVLSFLFKFFNSLSFFQSFLLFILSLLGYHLFSAEKKKKTKYKPHILSLCLFL